MRELIITVGIPASGKDTYLKQRGYMGEDYINVSFDQALLDVRPDDNMGYEEIFFTPKASALAEKYSNYRLESAKSDPRSAVINRTNLSRTLREPIITDFKKQMPTRAVALYFEPPCCLLIWLRNKWRERTERKFIPLHVYKTMLSSLQVPTLEEGFDEIVVVKQEDQAEQIKALIEKMFG